MKIFTTEKDREIIRNFTYQCLTHCIIGLYGIIIGICIGVILVLSVN